MHKKRLLDFLSLITKNEGLQARLVGLQYNEKNKIKDKETGEERPWPKNSSKQPTEKGWNSEPPKTAEAITKLKARFCEWSGELNPQTGKMRPPVVGLGIRTGSHAAGSDGQGEPFLDGCLIAIDCDIKGNKEQARKVFSLFLECANKKENEVSIRFRKGSTSWAILANVPGLERPKKEKYKTENGDVEFLGQGNQLAVCYLHPEDEWPQWTKGAPEAVEMTPEALQSFKARLMAEMGAIPPKAPKKPPERRQKALPEKAGAERDRLAEWLQERGLAKAVREDGAFDIDCPWAHEHGHPSEESETGATTYLPITYATGGFSCLRTHAEKRTRFHLIEWAKTQGFSELSKEELARYEVAGMEKPEQLPDGYFIEKGWIWKERRAACVPLIKTPFNVFGDAYENTIEGNAYRYSLEGVDANGQKCRLFIPKEWTEDRIYAELLKKGLQVERFKGAACAIAEFIHKMSARQRPRAGNSRTGWNVPPDWRPGDSLPERLAFILPGGECVGMEEGPLFFGPPRRLPLRGSVESWRVNVGALLRGQSKALVALSMPFFAPVARLMKWPGLFLFLTECSSGGKTTILEAVATVDGGEVKGANATMNALQAELENAPDQLRTMDELTARKGNELIGMGYLANGHGRQRLSGDGLYQLKEPKPVTPVVLGTGEKSLETQLSEAGGHFTAGQEARVFSFPADAGAGFGCFSHVDALPEAQGLSAEEKQARAQELGAKLSQLIRARAQDERGAVWRAWLAFLAAHVPACLGELRESAAAFETEAVAFITEQAGEPNSVGRRVIGAFAQLFACLDLANRRLGLGVADGDGLREVFKAEALAHLKFRDLFGASVEAKQGFDHLGGWLFENGARFKRHRTDAPAPCYGWHIGYYSRAGGPLYGVNKAAFERACREGGGEPKIVLKALKDAGLFMGESYRPLLTSEERAPRGLVWLRGRPGGGLAEPGVIYGQEACEALEGLSVWGDGFPEAAN